MYLLNHVVKNFRNIEEIVFSPKRKVNVIYGKNGEGKTNLLESIYMLTGAKSFRATKDFDLICRGEDYSTLSSDFFLDGRKQQIKLFLSEKGRESELNRGTRKKASALAGTFCAVLFSPEHLMIVKGSPNQRRKFIDTALCQISPKYLLELKKYSRLVFQKNNVLKNIYRMPDGHEMLDVYDSQLAEAARVVTVMRKNFCENLMEIAKHDYSVISGNREKIELRYISTLWTDEEIDGESGFDEFLYRRDSDIRAGYCTAGPHRDDIAITLDGTNTRVFASQGQQRSAVLALKLAEAAIAERAFGEKPVLLLDDVMSELDRERRDYLIDRLEGFQSFITGCDPSLICERVSAEIFEIKKGSIV